MIISREFLLYLKSSVIMNGVNRFEEVVVEVFFIGMPNHWIHVHCFGCFVVHLVSECNANGLSL